MAYFRCGACARSTAYRPCTAAEFVLRSASVNLSARSGTFEDVSVLLAPVCEGPVCGAVDGALRTTRRMFVFKLASRCECSSNMGALSDDPFVRLHV